jgi:hypothetical protein
MRIAVSTTFDENFDRLAMLTIPNHVAYCRKHGYEYNLHYAKYGSNQSTFANAYLLYVKQMLCFYDIIVTIDIDLLFMRSNISIESIFPSDAEQQLAEQAVIPGAGIAVNNGVIFWRNRQSSFDILSAILCDNFEELRLSSLTWLNFLDSKIKENHPLTRSVRVVNQHEMNTYWREYRDGDFIMHTYYATLEEKINAINSFLPGVI